MELGGCGKFQNTYVGEVAVFSFVVEAVADDEFVPYLEADVICLDVFGTFFVFGEEHSGVHGICSFFLEPLGDGGESAPGI